MNIGMLGLPNRDKGLSWGLHIFHVSVENGIHFRLTCILSCLGMVNVVSIVQAPALEVVVHLSLIQHFLFTWMCLVVFFLK